MNTNLVRKIFFDKSTCVWVCDAWEGRMGLSTLRIVWQCESFAAINDTISAYDCHCNLLRVTKCMNKSTLQSDRKASFSHFFIFLVPCAIQYMIFGDTQSIRSTYISHLLYITTYIRWSHSLRDSSIQARHKFLLFTPIPSSAYCVVASLNFCHGNVFIENNMSSSANSSMTLTRTYSRLYIFRFFFSFCLVPLKRNT